MSPLTASIPDDPVDMGSPSTSPTIQTESSPAVEQEDLLRTAEKVKEKGNISFKAGRYGEAIDLYTEAIREYDCLSSSVGSHAYYRTESC